MSMGISKAEISEKGITASGSIGGQKGNIGVSRDGVVELGINIGIAEIGFSTDYGGSVVVGFAGQNIVWGLEGGKISIRFGGIFEVDVEARDCVVTEIKRIAGMVVSSRTYPDPGCKLPEPSTPKLPITTTPLPPGKNPNYYSQCLTGSFQLSIEGYEFQSAMDWLLYSRSYEYSYSYNRRAASQIADVPYYFGSSKYVEITSPYEVFTEYGNTIYGVGGWSFFGESEQPIQAVIGTGKGPLNTTLTPGTGANAGVVKGQLRVKYVMAVKPDHAFPASSNPLLDSNSANGIFLGFTQYRFNIISIDPAPLCPTSPTPPTPSPQRFLPTAGNRPTMPESCCETLKADIQDIKDVLDIKNLKKVKGQNKGRMLEKSIPIESGKKRIRLEEKSFTTYAGAFDAIFSELEAFQSVLQSDYLIEKKFPVPSYLLFPGVDSEHTHEVDSYYSLFATLLQAMAHGMIVSPEVHMRDPTTGKTGDEGLTSKYLSATGWAEAIAKMLYRTIDEGNTSINMDVRNGITVTQLAVAVANISHKLDALIDCIGVPTTRSKGEIETSFSLIDDSGQGQGFDPKKSSKQLDLNDGMATEKLLAMLLKTRKNPIVKEVMAPKAKSLSQLIQELKGG